MAGKKRLSLCMLTKNNEEQLANCLQALKEIVDEIKIVDLGSSDQTIAIAKQAGAAVDQMGWNNNYSEAKNLCLDQATGRWILFLQPNETIPREQLKSIPPLLDNPNVEGYLLYIDHRSTNYRITSPVQSLRLFRNRKDYRYQYRAFERIPDELLFNIQDAGIRIVQQADPALSEEISALNLLLEKELQEHPEDSYLQYIYGIELLNQQKYQASATYFQKARQIVNLGYLFAPHLYKCLSWALISLEQLPEALGVLEEGIKYFSFYTDLLVLRGEIRKRFQQYGEAIQDLENSLKIMEQPDSMVPRPEIDLAIILETLGEIHEEILNYRQALAYYLKAHEVNATNEQLLAKIGELAPRADSAEVLEDLLKEALKQNNVQQLVTLMDILFRQRRYTQVLAHTEYLETFLGKGEQTESIKCCCYLMLGEVEKAELHFSALAKDSSFYNHLLPQRIESYWSGNQWQAAEQLLQEMDQIADIENMVKSIYHLLQRLLTGKEQRYPTLNQQELEIVVTTLENFLWSDQVEKAKILLPLLLQGATEEQYIKLAELWAKQNDYQTIEIICQRIFNKQKQLEFKQKIIHQLLRNEHLEAAQKLMKLGNAQPLGALEYVLWSKGFTKKVKEWLGKVKSRTIRVDRPQTSAVHPPAKPSRALPVFYHNLKLAKNNRKESCFEDNAAAMTCTKIHGEIGDLYAKQNKRKKALTAFLRALQWDPLDHQAQEKIRKLLAENPNQFYSFLEGKAWILEGSYFHHKQAFINYVRGVMDFKKQQFEQALAFFSKIDPDELSYPIALAYMISCLWLAGEEAKTEQRLDEQKGTAGVIQAFFRICQSYALDRLREGLQQYPYSELIMSEKERVSSQS